MKNKFHSHFHTATDLHHGFPVFSFENLFFVIAGMASPIFPITPVSRIVLLQDHQRHAGLRLPGQD
jgi:hypothetical protein